MLLYCRSAAPRLLLSFCCCCRSAAAAVVLPLYCCCRCRSAAAVLLLLLPAGHSLIQKVQHWATRWEALKR